MTSKSSGMQRIGDGNLRSLQFEARKSRSPVHVSLREGLASFEVRNESLFFSTDRQVKSEALQV